MNFHSVFQLYFKHCELMMEWGFHSVYYLVCFDASAELHVHRALLASHQPEHGGVGSGMDVL